MGTTHIEGVATGPTGKQASVRFLVDSGATAGQGVWHGKSDIDLAVEGLEPADFFPAYSACRDLLPRGLEWLHSGVEQNALEGRERVGYAGDGACAVRRLLRDGTRG